MSLAPAFLGIGVQMCPLAGMYPSVSLPKPAAGLPTTGPVQKLQQRLCARVCPAWYGLSGKYEWPVDASLTGPGTPGLSSMACELWGLGPL